MIQKYMISLLFLSKFIFSSSGTPLDTEGSHITIKFETQKIKDVLLMAYEKGVAKRNLLPLIQNERTYIFLTSKNLLPCELVLSYTANDLVYFQNIYLNTSSLKINIDPQKHLINWNGNQDNAIADRFEPEQERWHRAIVEMRYKLKEDQTLSEEIRQQKMEYEAICNAYNSWIDSQIEKNQKYWVSHFWKSKKVCINEYNFNPADQYDNLLYNFFKYEDFSDASLLNTSYYPNIINEFIYRVEVLALLKNSASTDMHQIFANKVIEKAKRGNPLVYELILQTYKDALAHFQVKLLPIIEMAS